jgi:hypothetical protein
MTASVKTTVAGNPGNTNNLSVPADTSISAGKLLLCLGSIDGTAGNPAGSTGWTRLYNVYQPSNMGMFLFARIGDGTATDNLSITWVASEVAACIMQHIDDFSGAISDIKWATSTPSGKQLSFDPPLLDTGINRTWLWIEQMVADTQTARPTRVSTDFSDLVVSTAGTASSSGQVTMCANRLYAGQSLDPDAMPLTGVSSNQDYVATATIAVPATPVATGPEPGRFLLAS